MAPTAISAAVPRRRSTLEGQITAVRSTARPWVRFDVELTDGSEITLTGVECRMVEILLRHLGHLVLVRWRSRTIGCTRHPRAGNERRPQRVVQIGWGRVHHRWQRSQRAKDLP